MAWQDAVTETQEGVRILVEVTPGAKGARFPDGFNPWRGRIGIRVTARAEGGKANAAVCALVAEVLDVPPSRVTVVAGPTDSRKALEVAGVQRDVVLKRLAPQLGEA